MNVCTLQIYGASLNFDNGDGDFEGVVMLGGCLNGYDLSRPRSLAAYGDDTQPC